MKNMLVLLIALCFVGHALSQDNCKTVAGAPSFNFFELIPYKYKYVLLPDTPEYSNLQSADETPLQVGGQYYTTFNLFKKDGSQSSTTFSVDSVDGATLYETIIVNGQPTSRKVAITFYAYKALQYAQFYACYSTGTDTDHRFAVLLGENQLTDELEAELLANDKQQNFNGGLISLRQ